MVVTFAVNRLTGSNYGFLNGKPSTGSLLDVLGPWPLYVVVGRGGPNLVRGMGNLADTLESLGLPYRFFGFDSAISEVVNYAKRVDEWMRTGGREKIAASLGMKAEAA